MCTTLYFCYKHHVRMRLPFEAKVDLNVPEDSPHRSTFGCRSIKSAFLWQARPSVFQNGLNGQSICISRGLAFGDVGLFGREWLCGFELEKVNEEGEGYEGDDYKALILWSQRRDSNP